jgi:hypothetical protein
LRHSRPWLILRMSGRFERPNLLGARRLSRRRLAECLP